MDKLLRKNIFKFLRKIGYEVSEMANAIEVFAPNNSLFTIRKDEIIGISIEEDGELKGSVLLECDDESFILFKKDGSVFVLK